MRVCAIIGCNTKTTKYRLPTRYRETWINNIWPHLKPRYKNEKNGFTKEPQNLTICPKHFVGGEKSDVEGAPGFLPTLFPGVDVDVCQKEMALTGAERAKRYRERKMNDPELRGQYIAKERNRKKASYCSIAELSDWQQKLTRKRWRSNSKKHRDAKKTLKPGVVNIRHALVPFSCIQCGAFHHSLDMLRRHKIRHKSRYKQTLIKAYNSSKTIGKASSMVEHEIESESKKTCKCKYCAKYFAETAILENHRPVPVATIPQDTVSLENHRTELVAPIPQGKAKQISQSDSRCQNKTNKKPFQCEHCHKPFKDRRNLTIHIRTHTGEKPYQCDLCPSKFAQSGHLLSHKRRHGDKSYQCKHCLRGFTQMHNLKRHVKSMHGIEETPYQCDECQQSFADISALYRHRRTHTKDYPYQCEHCQKSFKLKGTLTKHIRIHTKEKPYQCHHCKKCFAHANSLKYHISIHTKEKPYQCAQCERAFNRICDLKLHIFTHTKEKPYRCDVCPRSFTEAFKLKNHMLSGHANLIV